MTTSNPYAAFHTAERLLILELVGALEAVEILLSADQAYRNGMTLARVTRVVEKALEAGYRP